MNRREILRYTAWLTGARVAAPLATAVLAGCAEEPTNSGSASEGKTLHFFTPDDFEWITRLADTLLPASDSPAASEVGVPETLDAMLGKALEKDYVDRFRRYWKPLRTLVEREGFAGMTGGDRERLLSELETTESAERNEAREGLVILKQQVVIYYLTSETVGEEYLNYESVPGRYEPCISVDDVDNKKWAI